MQEFSVRNASDLRLFDVSDRLSGVDGFGNDAVRPTPLDALEAPSVPTVGPGHPGLAAWGSGRPVPGRHPSRSIGGCGPWVLRDC